MTVTVENWPLSAPFAIAGSTMVSLDVLVVSLAVAGMVGRGEAAGVDYLHDDVPRMVDEIETVRATIERGISREMLPDLLRSPGARNAVDCGLWSLESALAGHPVWQLAGLPPPSSLETTFTLGADDPGRMAAAAIRFASAGALKLKLTGESVDADRVRAVRAARPDAWLGIDADQGFDLDHFVAMVPVFEQAAIQLIEQPFPVGGEPSRNSIACPIPIAADESLQTLDDLSRLVGRFDFVNIKLDKCGGLTPALELSKSAEQLGFGLMVGNMVGTSLAMAPAFLLGQRCQITDLDGPLFLKSHRTNRVRYTQGRIHCDELVWG